MSSNPNMTTQRSLQTQKILPKEKKLAIDISDVKLKQRKKHYCNTISQNSNEKTKSLATSFLFVYRLFPFLFLQ
jgi:hypothetical protein